MSAIKKVVYLLSLILAYSITSNAQSNTHDHDHSQHEHEHAANEIGVGNFISYLTSEQELAYGIHIHYLRTIKDSKFGYGLGYEHILDEHTHNTIGIIGSYRLWPHLVLTVSPGIIFPNSENPLSRFVAHSELVYEFEIGRLHLGPSIEFATTFEQYHLGAGIHLGYAF